MKTLIHGLFIACLTVIMVSCTSTPTPQATVAASAKATPLSPAEQKSYDFALALLGGDKVAKAEKMLAKLAETHPGNVGLWINLANAAYQNNQLDTAEKALGNAQALQANNSEFHNTAGLVAVARGKYKEAEMHYVTAIKLNNNNASAHYNLALLYDVFYQDIRNAIPHYEQYLALINQDDEETINWIEELKLNLQKGSNE